jgi:biotin transporter BioY
VAKALNQVMHWDKFELKIKEDRTMSAWLIFFFGGVIGFCLGIIWLILMIAIGESEMCLEQFNGKEH